MSKHPWTAFIDENSKLDLDISIDAKKTTLGVFHWDKLGSDETDDVLTYFVEDKTVEKNIEKKAWVPFGVMGLDYNAARSGRFAEMNHHGLVLFDCSGDPKNPGVIYYNSNGKEDPRSIASSFEAFRKLIEVSNEEALAEKALDDLFAIKKLYSKDQAAEALKKADELIAWFKTTSYDNFIRLAEAHAHRGMALYKLGKNAEALDAFNIAEEKYSGCVEDEDDFAEAYKIVGGA